MLALTNLDGLMQSVLISIAVAGLLIVLVDVMPVDRLKYYGFYVYNK